MSIAGRCFYGACQTRLGHHFARKGAAMARRWGFINEFRMPVDSLDMDHEAVVELMRLWSRIHWSCGDGMMPPEQLSEIFRMARNWPVEGDIVELGSWVGLTTCYLATAARVRGRGHVYAVDTFEGTMEGGQTYKSVKAMGGQTYTSFMEQVRKAGVTSLVTPLVGLTTEIANQYPGRAIRVLLIDADHSYGGVKADFEKWSPLVAPGGLIIFHDYTMVEGGVARFVDNDVSQMATIEMTPGHVVDNVMAVTKRAETCALDPVSPRLAKESTARQLTDRTDEMTDDSPIELVDSTKVGSMR